MADRFYKPPEYPELPATPGVPDPGFIKVYGRSGILYALNSSGTEFDLTQSASGDINIDGGFANSVYLPTQSIDGGNA